MRLTYRLAVLALAGAIPLIFVGLAPWLLPAVIVYDILLAACTFADYLATPAPDAALQVEREVDDKLSLGAANRVVVNLRNMTSRPLSVTLRDEPPPDFAMDAPVQRSVTVAAGRQGKVTYHVTPPAKGDFQFGDVYATYPGILGSIARRAEFPAARAVKVYPNLHEIAKYELLARRGRLTQIGLRTIRMRGGGSDFESLREYVPGDEYKRIDWSATARARKLISRQYEAERSQNVVLLLDTGRNMLQPVQMMAKLDYVVNTALMLAYVAADADDKIGLMTFDQEIRAYLPPAKGRAQVYRILESLYSEQARMVESDYKAAFSSLARRWRRRSLVLLFTDLVDPESSSHILDAVPIIEGLHRVVCVTVSDPNIVRAARERITDADDVYRKAVAQEVLVERRQAISILKRRGVWSVDSPPESLTADLVNHYISLKNRAVF